MTIDGSILPGALDVRRDTVFHAVEATSGAELPQACAEATPTDVTAAYEHAEAEAFGTLAPEKRAAFLEAVAVAIEGMGDVLIETAMAKTVLPRPRPEGTLPVRNPLAREQACTPVEVRAL